MTGTAAASASATSAAATGAAGTGAAPRAREPDVASVVHRGDVSVGYEVHGTGASGTGEPTVVLLMQDSIVECRAWKGQVPYLARRWRVITVDPRGNGRSSRPTTPSAYRDSEMLDDVRAVLDAASVQRAVLVGVCTGAGHALALAACEPDRVIGVCAVNPGLRLSPPHQHPGQVDFEAAPGGRSGTQAEDAGSADGWARETRRSWQRDWPGYAEFFFGQMFPEPHSTKQREDAVAWACATGPDVMLAEYDAPPGELHGEAAAVRICEQVRCPVLVLCGTDDRCQPPARGRRVADLTGGDLVVLEGCGHLPMARDPVRVNLLLRSFVERAAAAAVSRDQPAASPAAPS